MHPLHKSAHSGAAPLGLSRSRALPAERDTIVKGFVEYFHSPSKIDHSIEGGKV